MPALLALLLAVVGHAATLDSAYYAPDRGTAYRWSENAAQLKTFFDKDYQAAGYVYAYVRSSGSLPIEATSFVLKGKPLQDLRDTREVIWWRLLPSTLEPGMVGEIMVRLRGPLTAPCDLTVQFSDGTQVTAQVSPSPNPIRIGTVGFTQARDTVSLVVENLDGGRRRLRQVSLDGRDITASCRLLAPGFLAGHSPVVIRLPKPLALGSYHVYTVRTDRGEAASCCLKTLDGWVPLGSYGFTTFEEFARNGCNGHNNFGRATGSQLDEHARLGMRQVTGLWGNEVREDERDHPGLFAYCLQDEPDCADYNFDKIPAALRVGEMAMEMEARAQKVRVGNPTKPSFLTLDLTFKPANWLIYGPIADITNMDCYPVSHGMPASEVREAVEACRLGAGPRQMTFTFQGVMEGPRDPAKFEQLTFPRQNFPSEQRLMMYYAIGEGARGLYNYIHCTENSEKRWSRGTSEFPELWNEIGQVYRELEHVAPLLALAHPTRLATCSNPKLWLRTLLCGDEAALLVWTNEDYEQKRLSVRVRPQTDVQIRVPRLRWLPNLRAWSVSESGFTPLEMSGDTLKLPRADVAGLVLLASDPGLPMALRARYEDGVSRLGRKLLEQERRAQAARAREITASRLIVGEYAAYRLTGEPVQAYGVKLPGAWNPQGTEQNAFEFGVNDTTETSPTQGVHWKAKVSPESAAKDYMLYVYAGTWGRAGILRVTDPEGKTLAEREVSGSFGGQLQRVRVTTSSAGEYEISFTIPGSGPKGGRASCDAYFVPFSEVFDDALH